MITRLLRAVAARQKRMPNIRPTAVALSLACACAAPDSRAVDGFYDFSFLPPNGRRLLTEHPTAVSQPKISIDGQSRLLIGANCRPPGAAQNRACVARLQPGGSTDIYGSEGTGRYTAELDTMLQHLIAFDDGRALAVVGPGIGAPRMIVLDANGAPSPQAFGGTGLAAFSGQQRVRAVAAQPDGRVVVGISPSQSGGDYVLRRYDLGTGVDPGFAGGERVIGFDDNGASNDQLRAIAVAEDGRILAAGDTNGGVGIVRLLPNGVLDSTFGVGGKVRHAIGLNPFMLSDSGGRVLLFFSFLGPPTVHRLAANGSLESAYNQCATADAAMFGRFNLNGSRFDGNIMQVVMQRDGKPLVLLTVNNAGSGQPFEQYYGIARLDTQGCLDGTFGTNGQSLGNFNPGGTSVDTASMAIGNGGLMVAGLQFDASNSTFRQGIARIELAAGIPLPVLLVDGFE